MTLYDFGETVVVGNRIEWTVKDFLSQEASKVNWIHSKDFYFKSEKFNLSLYIPDIIEFCLECPNKYSVHFSIRKKNGEETETHIAHYIDDTFFISLITTWNELKENKDELVPNGHLTIICHVLEEGEEPAKKESRLEAVSFEDECKAMYESGELCDFDVKVQDRIFRTHKFVLAARSSTFASMFRHDQKKKMVEIVDCDSETMEAFLKFLYGWKNEVIIPENVVSLYEVADYYDVQNLKSECRRFMMKNLSTEIFCDVVCLALKHEERELIKHATEYFNLNKKNIFLSAQWQIFLKENPTCVNEFLIKTCD